MNSAIIVAAGTGKRFGGDIPKQFLNIHGKPLLVYTLEKFESCSAIDEVILVVAGDEIGRGEKLVEEFSLKKVRRVIEGGANRAKSVANGFASLDKSHTQIVVVHDGARPLVTATEISATISKAEVTGAACLVARVDDTIKEVLNDKIVRTIDRANLRRALTPQAFRYEILKRALAASNLGEEITDESYLLEKIGETVSLVEGSSKNIKVTNGEDFSLVEKLLENK